MSLVLQYNFSSSNISNNTIYDSITKTYDATMINNPIPNSAGPNSCTPSMQFSSSNSQYININSTVTGTNGLSYACWFKADPSNGNFARIFDFATGEDNSNIIMFIYGGAIGLAVFSGTATLYEPFNSTAFINNNIWTHIVWTLTNPTGWNIYVNGVLYTQYSTAPYPPAMTRTNNYIARSNWSADPYFTGSIADFRVYDGVITQSTVTSIYGQACVPLNLYPLINGQNNLYTPIYCNNLVPTNDNFITCQNCNFGGATVTNTSTQSGEQNCLNTCHTNNMCTSYSYDSSQSSNNCTQYSSRPSQLLGGVNNVNSGYTLNFTKDYNSLSTDQQETVKAKCASQYLNNTFLQNNDIDIGSCLTVDNSTTPSNFNVDAQCLFNIYQTNNLNPPVVNTSTYDNNSLYTDPTTDSTIDNYGYSYDDYLTLQIQKSNLSNNLEKEWMTKESNKSYQQTLENQNNILKTSYTNSIKSIANNDIIYDKNIVNIIENFNNNNNTNKNNFLMLLFIFILVIFLYYILRKIK